MKKYVYILITKYPGEAFEIHKVFDSNEKLLEHYKNNKNSYGSWGLYTKVYKKEVQ